MENVGAFLVMFPSLILITAMIIRYMLKRKELEMRGSDAEWGPEVDALRDELDDTRAQLADMQERIEFTERLLAAGRESQENKSG